MVYFPIRKCYQAVKISMLVILVVAVLTLFEQWRGGNRNAGATYSDPLVAEYERQILEDEARIIPGLGEGGVAAHLMGEEKKLGEESEKKLAINVYLSDRIPYNRTLKDFRNPACQRVVYDAELPSASVIIIFHNEPYSVVVRTLWSVVNSAKRSNPWFKHANFVDQQTGRVTNLGYPGQDPNSPYVYLKEIILVDDNSTLPELKGKLSHYIRTRLPPNLIRILRLPDREGLMRARIRGARSARGEVLIFLDAHCEGQRDWLRPLLQRVRHKRDTAITPIIDVIDQTTFELQASESFQVGGFTFMGHFTWTEVPDREKKRRGSDIAPTWSPTMAGGLFAINRDYFWELGAYDEQMAGWGGENLEMSFRIWQCGGTLETIPCSRVGHVFRAFHPYGLPASSDTHGINTARMAEVWMDEYAELFYLHRPDLRNNPRIGDVTHRRVLRDKLRCKSFQWYLDNVYRDKFVPVRDVYGYGRFKNPATQLCLDTLQREGDKVALGAYPCYPALQATQYFSLSNRGEIRDETDCASVQPKRVNPEDDKELTRAVVMSTCHGKGRDQKWVRLPSGQLRHGITSLCLTAPRTVSDVTATVCDPSLTTQIWHIDYNEDNDFRLDSDEAGAMSEEQYNRISKLRGQRSNRISRSLLSYPDNALDDTALIDNATVRRHTHKVINNGRVFERNKVSEIRAANKVLNKMDIEGPAQPPTQPLQPAPPSLPQVFSPAAKPHKKPKVPPEMSAMNPKRVAHPKGSGFADVEDVPSRASNHVIGRERGVDKKLVIEDFVEVNDEHTTEVDKMFVERHKHKRKPRPHAQTSPRHAHATAPQKPATDSSEPLRNDGDSDGLDAPLMDDTLDRSEPREDGPVGAARFRHERLKAGEGSRSGYPPVVGDLLPDISELQRAMRAEDTENRARGRHDTRHGGRHDDFRDTDLEQAPIDTDVHFNKNELTAFEPRYSRSQTSKSTSANTNANIEGTESEEGPVKLVMRSNVTLHLGLGDEILNWRNKATEDIVNEFINELSIPSNYSAYTEGERYATGDTASTPADIDTTHAHTQRRTRTHRGDVTSDHSSSSSESSGE